MEEEGVRKKRGERERGEREREEREMEREEREGGGGESGKGRRIYTLCTQHKKLGFRNVYTHIKMAI